MSSRTHGGPCGTGQDGKGLAAMRANVSLEGNGSMHRRLARVLISALLAATVPGLVWWWRPPPSRAQNAPAAPAVAVRFTLGVRDSMSRDWSGRVTAGEGSITGVDGVRFEGTDAIQEPNAWSCTTHDGVVGTVPLNMPPG